MTITLSDTLSLANTDPNTRTSEFKSEANPTQDGPSFGQFMLDMLQLQTHQPAAAAPTEASLVAPQGQGIADPLALVNTSAMINIPAWPLKAVTLGPHLNVITPDTTAPDTKSLEAFARAQGLDEQAVSWLFGNHSGGTTLIPTLDPKVEGGGADALGTMEAFGVQSIALASNPGSTLPSTTSSTTANTNTKATSTATATATLGLQVQTVPQNQVPNHPAMGQANGPASGQMGAALVGVHALWATAEESGKPAKTSANSSTITEEALPIQMLRMPPPAAVWMQRSAMNNALQDKAVDQKEMAISTSDLDLGADWGGETLQQMLGSEGSVSGTGTHGTAHANFAPRWDAQAASRHDLVNPSGPAQDLPDTQARSENIQNLADKMGQAVGQRILSEMEKGQWHLKLQLRPATLGHIEVEMRMRSGEFDAVFTAPNGTTRELLQEGLSKLRETLSQMGMDVANIHVGGGQTGQSGGDSTPGFCRGTPAQTPASAPESTAEITRAPRVKDPKDGLDVLV